jgi:hypothetical protein
LQIVSACGEEARRHDTESAQGKDKEIRLGRHRARKQAAAYACCRNNRAAVGALLDISRRKLPGACRARSRAEFAAKIAIVLEEADESHYWLEILYDSGVYAEQSIHGLMQEANELIAIFTASTSPDYS